MCVHRYAWLKNVALSGGKRRRGVSGYRKEWAVGEHGSGIGSGPGWKVLIKSLCGGVWRLGGGSFRPWFSGESADPANAARRATIQRQAWRGHNDRRTVPSSSIRSSSRRNLLLRVETLGLLPLLPEESGELADLVGRGIDHSLLLAGHAR